MTHLHFCNMAPDDVGCTHLYVYTQAVRAELYMYSDSVTADSLSLAHFTPLSLGMEVVVVVVVFSNKGLAIGDANWNKLN